MSLCRQRSALGAIAWQGRVLWLVLSLGCCAALPAQILQPGVMVARSRSGQFVIQSLPASANSRAVVELETRTNFVRLDPTLLAVSSERIKRLLGRELGAPESWSGKIFIRVYPVNSAEDAITIASEQFRDGWQYGIALPNVVERARYVRTLVGVLLLELSNRNAFERSAELPTWLVEGLSQQLLVSSELQIILPPPTDSRAGIKLTSLFVSSRRENPLERAHRDLAAGRPLGFEQLSWPTDQQLTGETGELYRSSAQLFVSELLGLPNGRACLRAMLADLPKYYNWQFAFLHAFQAYFKRPLDIEKWWSLHLAHFTGRELAQTWSIEESWQKLDEIIRSAVEVRLVTNDLPLHVQVPLQTMLREWSPPRQTEAFEAKLRELQAVRLRVAPEFVPLLDEYCGTMQTWLQNHQQSSSGQFFRKKSALQRSTQETIRQLDDLDSRRSALKPASNPRSLAQSDRR